MAAVRFRVMSPCRHMECRSALATGMLQTTCCLPPVGPSGHLRRDPNLPATSSGRGRRDSLRPRHANFALLVGQTFVSTAGVLEGVPTRPSQNDPKRVIAWNQRRALLGMRIQELRLDLGLTQEQLAARSGVSRNVLMDIEHGRRAILSDRIFDIAAALDVTAAALLDGIG